MMDRTLIRDFWRCGDNQLIVYAITRARLNRLEKEVLYRLLDECETQEKASEEMNISTRRLQYYWYSATDKLMSIPWVVAYAKELRQK